MSGPTVAAAPADADLPEIGAASDPGGAVRRPVRWVILLPLLPAVASLASAAAQGWVPVADGAVAAVRAVDVGRGHLPLLGLPATISEFTGGPQRYHPGPLLFMALAPFTWAFGAQAGAAVGAVAVNTAAAMGAIAATARSGRRALTLAMAATTALTGMTVWGPGHLYDPFNTMLPALALLCGFVLAWRLACGDGAMLPWAVLVASFCIQTHVVYALPLACTLGPATLIAVGPKRWRPPDTPRPSRRALAGAAALGVVLWAGPLLEAARNRGGNLRALAGGTGGAAVVGAKGALAALVHLFNLPPVQFTDISDSTFLRAANLSASLVGLGALWLAVTVVRHGHPEVRRLLVVAACAVLGAALTVSALPDEPLKSGQMSFYKAVWPFAWFALVGGWATTWQLRPARARVAGIAVTVLALVLTAQACIPFPIRNDFDPDSWLFDATPQLADDLERTLPHDATYRLTAAGGARYLLLMYGLVAGLDDRGLTVGVDRARVTNFGEHRVIDDRPGLVTLHVQDPAVARPAGGRLVARFRPEVDDAARRELEQDLLERARTHGTVRLTSDGRRYLGDTLLGRAGIGPQEVRRLQEDPSGLLDRPAEELVALYRNFWVIEPALPDDLQAEYVRLLGPTPVDVWAVTGG